MPPFSEFIEEIVVTVVGGLLVGLFLWLFLHRRKKPEKRERPGVIIDKLIIGPGAKTGPITIGSDATVTLTPYKDGMAAQAPKEEHLQFRNYLENGDKEFYKGRFREAEIFFNKAHEYAVNSGDQGLIALASYELGAALGQQGKHDEAEKYFSMTLKIDPNFVEAYYNRGIVYYYKGEHDRAIDDFNQAIKLNPNLADAYNNRGAAYGGKGEHDRAIDDFNQAIKLNPNYAKAYYNRGTVYGGKGEHDRAVDDYNHALKLNPNYAEAYYNRGTVYGGKGEYDRAIDDFNHALKLNPNHAKAMVNMGFAYLGKNDVKNAQKWFNEALERKDQLPDKGERILKKLEELKS